jgi:hypothetical protein
MKKLFTLVCCVISLNSFGQGPTMSYSDPFEEPEAMDLKVVQASNGNTFLFSFTKTDGIDITVFDKNRKQIGTNKLSGSADSWDRKNMLPSMFSGVSKGSRIPAIYAIGDQVVLFLEQVADREPSLYRIILSSADGKLVKEEKIAEMPAYAKGSGYAMAFGHVQPKGFFVERDPSSNAYAVLVFDGFAPETDKRIEIIHYDASHQELGRSYYDAPEMRYKYINFLGMVVNGTKEVHVATYCYGTNASTSAGSKIYISTLGEKALVHHPLEFTRDLKETRASLVSNPVTRMLELFIISEVSAKNSEGFGKITREVLVKELFVIIDPTNFTVVSNSMPTNMMATKFRKQRYDKDEERYTGVPMNVVVNPDGTTTIVSEDEIPVLETPTGPMAFVNLGYGKSVFFNGISGNIKYNWLKDIGISDYDQGKEKYGYVVRKSQKNKTVITPLMHREMRNNKVTFDLKKGFGMEANVGFYSFDYISTPSGRFVIFNDHPKNFERDAEKNPKTLQGVSEANTICYKLNGGEISKMYFFGEPDKTFDNRLALISSGDYSEATGDYAVMMIEKAGRKKQARLAWAHVK